MHTNLSLYCSAGEYATPAGGARPRGKTLPGKFPRCGAVAPAPALVLTLALALTAACAPSTTSSPPGIVLEAIEKLAENAERAQVEGAQVEGNQVAENQVEGNQAGEEQVESDTPEVPEASEQPKEPEYEATVHVIDLGQQIVVTDDPVALTEQLEHTPTDQAASLLLPAIANYIEQGKLSTAQTLIEQLQARQISGSQRRALTLYQAQLAQALGNHSLALELVRLVEQSPKVSDETSAQLLFLRANSQQALEHTDEAVMTLLLRDKLLEQSARVDNQRRILTLLDLLDPLSLTLLRENLSDNIIDGWIALGEILRSGPSEDLMTGIVRWRSFYRDHPVEPLLLDHYLSADESVRYRHIALLLPMTSPFGEAAKAFYDGFMASHNHDLSPHQPMVTLYDIGETESLVALYYQAALNDGADFLVGPLGHRAVNALFADSRPELPMLMIGDIPEDKIAPNLYGISLSPEQEGRQVADRAFADGHRQAGIFRSNTEWGWRLSDAFAQQWESLGGTVVGNKSFAKEVSSHPQIIKEFLGLDKSIGRQRILAAELDINLEFTPRRRDDIDLLFLAANASQARLLAPQLRFFQAHDLPFYATSSIYGGKPSPAVDADLDGIIFGEMDWILDTAVLTEPEPQPLVEAETGLQQESPEDPLGDSLGDSPGDSLGEAETVDTPASAQPTENAEPGPSQIEPAQTTPGQRLVERRSSPYYHTDLDRLYALGLDSYNLLPRLKGLRKNQRQRYFGEAVDISVKADGNALRHLTWARFDRGLPVPMLGVTDLPEPAPVQ